MAAIDVQDLVKRFGDKTVVDHVSLRVETGEISGFIGPNGSGKTTTMRMLCGLLSPDDGRGTVLGHDIRAAAQQVKPEIGYMTQAFSLYADLTIEENLAFVARLYGMPDPRRAVRETLSDLGLLHRRAQLAGTLSGGWKQRLALAASVMHKPRLLLLDEPTAGVDPLARREFWDEIHERAAEGLTVLVSTHYMDEAERCHSINLIVAGRLLAKGPVERVVQESGLVTRIVTGHDVRRLRAALSADPAVEQVAPFGRTLHVVGRDGAALDAAIRRLAPGAAVEAAETTLEDVFIHHMRRAGLSGAAARVA
ncbi:MAG: ABC transporter ATP-binding protein [Alphaproteobacteria bacterium]|nr:MAG: ABC transporter ATP-binding protein [Alphaproteobacteria bacterium]